MLNKIIESSFKVKNLFLIILVLSAGIYTIYATYITAKPLITHYDDHTIKIEGRLSHLHYLQSQLGYVSAIHNFKNYVLRNKEKYRVEMIDNVNNINSAIDDYKLIKGLDEEEIQALATIKKTMKNYYDNLKIVQKMHREGKSITAIDKVVYVEDKYAREALKFLNDEYHVKAKKDKEELNTLFDNLVKELVFIILTGVSLTIACIIGIYLSVQKQFKIINTAMETTANQGNLSHTLRENGKNELSLLAKHFNKFILKIKSIVDLVIHSSSALADDGERMLLITQKSSERARYQQDKITEVTRVIDQVAIVQNEIAESASNAQAQANQVKQYAGDCVSNIQAAIGSSNQMIEETESVSKAIIQLQQDSRSIDQIIGVINGIAEQTNLLALNAAIEAARAGESGRGFAVVADEVRSLSHKVSSEIRSIQEQVSRVQQGTQKVVDAVSRGREKTEDSVYLIQATSDSLTQIIASIESILSTNEEIALKSEIESQHVKILQNDINTINEIASESASSALLASKTSSEFKSMAEQMQGLVRQFLKPDDGSVPGYQNISSKATVQDTGDIEMF